MWHCHKTESRKLYIQNHLFLHSKAMGFFNGLQPSRAYKHLPFSWRLFSNQAIDGQYCLRKQMVFFTFLFARQYCKQWQHFSKAGLIWYTLYFLTLKDIISIGFHIAIEKPSIDKLHSIIYGFMQIQHKSFSSFLLQKHCPYSQYSHLFYSFSMTLPSNLYVNKR